MVVDVAQLDNAFSVGGAFFFTASASIGNELFRSDGTAAGTVPVFDLWPGGSSSPMIADPVSDLPAPDSPTTPSTSPSLI
jgi:ELWxxDGT repeat protein